MRVGRGRAGRFGLGTVALLLLVAACGGDEGAGEAAEPASSPEPTSALLASIEADGTDAEQLQVGTEGEVSLAVVDDGEEVVAYLCDGYAGEWFTGTSGGALESAAGTVLSLDGAIATVTPSDEDAYAVALEAADGDDDLLRFADAAGVGGLVVHDGVFRGAATRGGATGIRPSPAATTTTTTGAPDPDRFVRVAVVDVPDLGRSSTSFDLDCVVARQEVERAFDDLEASLHLLYERLARERRDEAAALPGLLPGLEDLIAQKQAQIDALTEQVRFEADPNVAFDLNSQIVVLTQEIDATRGEVAAIPARVAQLEVEAQELEADLQEALAALLPQEAQVLQDLEGTCG